MEIQNSKTLESLKILKENDSLSFVLENWIENLEMESKSIESLKGMVACLGRCDNDRGFKNNCAEALSSLSEALCSLYNAKRALERLK